MKKLLQNAFVLLLSFLLWKVAAQDGPDPTVDAAAVLSPPIAPNHPSDISVCFHLMNDGMVDARVMVL